MIFERVDIAVTLLGLLAYAERISPDYDELGRVRGAKLSPCSPECRHFERADPLGATDVRNVMDWLVESAPGADHVPVIMPLNPRECASILCGLTMFTADVQPYDPPELVALDALGMARLKHRLDREAIEHERRRTPRREPGVVISLASRSVS